MGLAGLEFHKGDIVVIEKNADAEGNENHMICVSNPRTGKNGFLPGNILDKTEHNPPNELLDFTKDLNVKFDSAKIEGLIKFDKEIYNNTNGCIEAGFEDCLFGGQITSFVSTKADSIVP